MKFCILFVGSLFTASISADVTVNAPPHDVMLNGSSGQFSIRDVRTVEPQRRGANVAGGSQGSEVQLDTLMAATWKAPWKIHYERLFKQGRLVSWVGSGTSAELLNIIAKQNNFHVAINERDHVIGIANNAMSAPYLASLIPQIWYVDPPESLETTLTRWGKKAGYGLEWRVEEQTLPVTHPATFYGPLIGDGGVLQKILDATENTGLSLQAELYSGNNVISIDKSQYRQGGSAL